MTQKTLQQIRKLVGPITVDQLKYVECAVSEKMGIFIPSVGQCGYAVLPQHTHPAYSFIIAFEANSPVSPKGIIIRQDEYGCTAMSPDIPHEEEPSDSFIRFVAIQIETSFFQNIWSTYSKTSSGPFFWTPFAVPQSIMTHVKEFFSEFNAHQTGVEEILKAIEVCITHIIVRAILKMSVSVEGISQRFEIQRAIELMHTHFGEKLSVPLLAKKVNCSESHFSRLFKQETGTSPSDYIIKIRVDKAKKLLSSTAKNATEIALMCGFSSTAHFSGTFKQLTGVSPLHFRKNVT
jgi:AraC-like DNA-binding protein